MTRTHAEIDADLARWSDTAGRIGKSIEALTQDPVFLRLKAQSRLGALSGPTKARAEAAVVAGERLWTLYLSLDKRLAEAAELRRSNNPFGREERFETIDAILNGPSVSLPSQEIGLARASLAGAPDRAATFAEALAAMQAAFDAVRDTVLAAGRVWARTTDFAEGRDAVARLADEAKALGCAPPPALIEAAALIDRAAGNADADPIGADDARAEIGKQLALADEALASARADRAAAQALLAAAEARLADLAARRTLAERGRADRLAKIKQPAPASDFPPDATPELRAWLATLGKTFGEGRPRAALVGGKSWTAEADRVAAQLDAIAAEDARLLAAREDLRGRFSALAAKAQARAADGRLGGDTAALLADTRALLFGAATPLPEAVARLRRCEAGMASLPAGGEGRGGQK